MKDEIFDKIVKMFDNSFNTFEKISLNIIRFYYSNYKYLENELKEHDENEPLKFFKKRHNKWLLKREELIKDKEEMLKQLVKEYKELAK